MVGQCRNGGCLAQHEFLTSHWRHQMGTPATPKQRRTSDRAISFRLACLIMKPSARLTGHCSPFTRVETFYCLVPNSLTAFTCGSRLCCNCYAMSRVDCGGPPGLLSPLRQHLTAFPCKGEVRLLVYSALNCGARICRRVDPGNY